MANFRIKLVDRTGSSSQFTADIQNELKNFFDRVFAGTSDKATVAWGPGSTSDTIVVHFVQDVSSSYMVKTMKRPPTLRPNIGGHTSMRGKEICSEIYKTQTSSNGRVRNLSGRDYAKLAFHECLHNVLPRWSEQDFMGKGGLADTPVGSDLNSRDIDLMRKGIGITANYTQKL